MRNVSSSFHLRRRTSRSLKFYQHLRLSLVAGDLLHKFHRGSFHVLFTLKIFDTVTDFFKRLRNFRSLLNQKIDWFFKHHSENQLHKSRWTLFIVLGEDREKASRGRNFLVSLSQVFFVPLDSVRHKTSRQVVDFDFFASFTRSVLNSSF